MPGILRRSSPNPQACLVMASLIEAMYRQNRAWANSVATAIDAEIVAWVVDPSTFPPDYLVIKGPWGNLVACAGTTNKPQWIAHMASGFGGVIDQFTGTSAVRSFFVGEQAIEPGIRAALGNIAGQRIFLTGHSYGAAAAHIFGVHLRFWGGRPLAANMLTFGEPMAFSKSPPVPSVGTHLRLVGSKNPIDRGTYPLGIDPVTLTPPPRGGAFDVVGNFVQAVGAGAADWQHRGSQYGISEEAIVETSWFHRWHEGINEVQASAFFLNAPNFAEHYAKDSYLKKSVLAYLRGTRTTVLDGLLSFAGGVPMPNPFRSSIPPGVFAQSPAGVLCITYLNELSLGGRLTVRQASDMRRSLLTDNSGSSGVAFLAFINDPDNFREYDTPNSTGGFVVRRAFFAQLPSEDIRNTFAAIISSVAMFGVQPPAMRTATDAANAAIQSVAASPPPPAPQTPAQVRAMVVMDAVNNGVPPPPPPSLPEPIASTALPVSFLAQVVRSASGEYLVTLSGEALILYATKSRAKIQAKAINKMFNDMRFSQGFEIDKFTERIRDALSAVSGGEGLINGIPVPLPGF